MRRPAPRPSRWLHAGGLALLLLVLTAGPAAADPPGPTNYRAEVVGLEPATEGVDAAVLGGDSFLQLRVDDGHEAVVRGYDGTELYLRFDANGEVWENHRSRSYYQNQSRYSPDAADRPAELGADVPPDWVRVSTDGTYAWHDHRIHWMSPATLPFRADAGDEEGAPVDPSASEPQQALVWTDPVPIIVDGAEVGIVGEVTYLPDASPLPTIAAGLVALLAVVAIGWRSPVAGILVGAVGGAVVALAVSLPQVVGQAAGVQGQPLQLVVPGIALLVVLAGLSVRSRSGFALVVAGAAGVPLLGWVGTNLGAVTAPIVPPGTLPDDLVRVAVGLVAGGGLGALVVGVRDLLAGDAWSLDPGPEPATTP
jgi:hypothetical protein